MGTRPSCARRSDSAAKRKLRRNSLAPFENPMSKTQRLMMRQDRLKIFVGLSPSIEVAPDGSAA